MILPKELIKKYFDISAHRTDNTKDVMKKSLKLGTLNNKTNKLNRSEDITKEEALKSKKRLTHENY